jgi:hypothetical protein
MPVLGVVASSVTGSTLGAFYGIQTITVGGAGSSFIEFASIPQTYKHLVIRTSLRDSRAAQNTGSSMTFNSDSAANYSSHDLSCSGTTVYVDNYPNDFYITLPNQVGNNADSQYFGTQTITIPDYSNTSKFKTALAIGGHEQNNTNTWIMQTSGNWRNNSAITNIKIYPLVGPWRQYSVATLYGVTG